MVHNAIKAPPARRRRCTETHEFHSAPLSDQRNKDTILRMYSAMAHVVNHSGDGRHPGTRLSGFFFAQRLEFVEILVDATFCEQFLVCS